MKIIPIIFGSALLLAACAAPDPSLREFTKLVPGQSTVQDAVATLGRPFSVADIGNTGVATWMDTRGGGYRSISILFDSQGRMIRVLQASGL